MHRTNTSHTIALNFSIEFFYTVFEKGIPSILKLILGLRLCKVYKKVMIFHALRKVIRMKVAGSGLPKHLLYIFQKTNAWYANTLIQEMYFLKMCTTHRDMLYFELSRNTHILHRLGICILCASRAGVGVGKIKKK